MVRAGSYFARHFAQMRAHQPLRQHHVQRRADQVRLDAHVDQPRDGRAGVVGVQGAEDQVAGQRGLDGRPGGLLVADLADHDDVGVLPQQRPQRLRERHADLRLHLELVDQRQVVLDRVLDRADVVLHRADGVQRGVERGRFSAAGRPGHQDDAVGGVDVLPEDAQHVLGKAQVFEVQRDGAGIEHADDGLFAVRGGEGAHAEVDLAAFEHHVDPPVLRQPPLADVHRAHDLDAAGDGVQQVLRHLQRLVQPAVDAVAHPHAAFGRLDVDVAGPFLHRVENDVVHQADDRRLAGDLLHVADVLDGLFDQRHVGRVGVLDDVVDHEDLRVRQRGDHPPDVFRAGGDDLHLRVGQPADLVDQEQVRRLGDGDRQHAADQEQRQHEVLLDVLPRQDVDDLRVEQPGVELGVGHAVLGGQALDHLVLGAVLQLDEDLAQQLLRAPPASASPAQTASRRA